MSRPELTEPDTDAYVIPPATHTRLASANDGECWLCGLHGMHATRVVTTADLPLLSELRRRGITQDQLTDLNAFENLVFLCTACHVAFNNPVDVWIFLPTSLDTIITAEEAFHVRRQSAATLGERLPRPPATAPTLSTLYSRYQIRSRYVFTRVFTDNPTRVWPGSPLAAIIRSARIVAGFERLPIDEGGMPIDALLKLQHLLLLFGTPEPRLVVQPAGANQSPSRSSFDAGENTPSASPDDTGGYAHVGRRFNSAIQYVHHHAHNYDWTAEAGAWVESELIALIDSLKTELDRLEENKDKPLLLPEYAVNPAVPLRFFSSKIPFLLVKYNKTFINEVLWLFNLCELNGTCVFHTIGGPCLLIEMWFARGGVQSQSQGLRNRLFDAEFANELVSSIQRLTMEPK